jgi:hypothetical protein
MKRLLLVTVIFLTACGLSAKMKEEIALITCNIMDESGNMDGAVRLREINKARGLIGASRFLGSDDAIKESFIYGLCNELVLNDPQYGEKLITARELESAERRLDVSPREGSSVILDLHKYQPLDSNDGPDFGVTGEGLPHSWIIEVGCFVESPKAKILLEQLVYKGYEAFIAPTVIAGELHFHVLVGPGIDRQRVMADRDNIDLLFKTKSILLKYKT